MLLIVKPLPDNRKTPINFVISQNSSTFAYQNLTKMKILRDRILKDGKCYEGGILKVDKFINHQMDPNLMKAIAVEFIRRYASTEINKIITIEASGIAPAIMMGFLLDLPVVFAKKKKPSTMDNMLSTRIFFVHKAEGVSCGNIEGLPHPQRQGALRRRLSGLRQRCQGHHRLVPAGRSRARGHGIHY